MNESVSVKSNSAAASWKRLLAQRTTSAEDLYIKRMIIITQKKEAGAEGEAVAEVGRPTRLLTPHSAGLQCYERRQGATHRPGASCCFLLLQSLTGSELRGGNSTSDCSSLGPASTHSHTHTAGPAAGATRCSFT